MGVDRLRAMDQDPSQAPLPGEMVVKDGDILVGVGGGYVSLQKIDGRVNVLWALMNDKGAVRAAQSYTKARDFLKSLGVDLDNEDFIF